MDRNIDNIQQTAEHATPLKAAEILANETLAAAKATETPETRLAIVDKFLRDYVERASAGEIISSKGYQISGTVALEGIEDYFTAMNSGVQERQLKAGMNITSTDGYRDAFATLISNAETAAAFTKAAEMIVAEGKMQSETLSSAEHLSLDVVSEVGDVGIQAAANSAEQPSPWSYEASLRRKQESQPTAEKPHMYDIEDAVRVVAVEYGDLDLEGTAIGYFVDGRGDKVNIVELTPDSAKAYGNTQIKVPEQYVKTPTISVETLPPRPVVELSEERQRRDSIEMTSYDIAKKGYEAALKAGSPEAGAYKMIMDQNYQRMSEKARESLAA